MFERQEHGAFLPEYNPSDYIRQMMVRQRIIDPEETPKAMLDRVIGAVFSAETEFGTSPKRINEMSCQFAQYMVDGYVMLGTPTLTNAGRNVDSALSSCVVIPVDLRDKLSAEDIIKSYYRQNMGSGFDFTEYEDPVGLLGWVNELSAQETATGQYDRYIGNMGSLHISHPRIEEFIDAKREDGVIQHFNISVDLSDDFVLAVKSGSGFMLADKRIVDSRKLFRRIAENAWFIGDPGILSLDRMNRDNPISEIASYSSTPPCGEMGLSKGETCQFGYINLARFVEDGKINYKKLEEVTRLTTRVLDNAIEYSINRFPTALTKSSSLLKRKIGIGACGLAEMLIACGISYDSEKGRTYARNVLSFINYVSKVQSVELAEELGSCLAMLNNVSNKYYTGRFLERKYWFSTETVSSQQWKELSDYIIRTGFLRNILTTALPPSGRSSIILGTTSSIEPIFTIYDNSGDIKQVIKEFISRKFPVSSSNILEQARLEGSFQRVSSLPFETRQVLKTAKEVSYEDHVSMVASLAGTEGVVDEAASKTVNLPQNATVDEVESIFMMAYDLGLKNIAVYRDTSKAGQPEKL